MRGALVVCALLVSVGVLGGPAGALDRNYVPDQTAAVVEAAKRLYGENVTVYNATDPLFSEVFPNHALKVVHSVDGEGVRLRHAMAYRALTQQGYDVTRNFTALMTDGGVLLTSSADALKVGKLYATLANAEIQLGREVAYAANSTVLNHTIHDPSATGKIGGWLVKVTTWGGMWGALVNWTIDFGTADIDASQGTVVAVARGGYEVEMDRILPREGLRMENDYGSGYSVAFTLDGDAMVPPWETGTLDLTPAATATTFDGSVVQVKYQHPPGESVPSGATAEAQVIASGLAWAYNRSVQASIAPAGCASGNQTHLPMRYFINDSDCVLEVILRDAKVVGSPMSWEGNETRVQISATSGFRAAIAKYTYYPNPVDCDDTCLARVIMMHELFHAFQRLYTPGVFHLDPKWDTVVEGIARMQETLTASAYAQVPNSTWYRDVELARTSRVWPSGHTFPPNLVVDNTQKDLCELSYYAAGYWGAVYQRDGGIDTLHDVMRRVHENKTAQCLATLPRIVDDALAAADGNHTSFNASLVDYAIRLYQKNLSWGDPYDGNASVNWSLHQPDVPSHAVDDDFSILVPGYGFQYISLPTDRGYHVDCASNDGWSHRLLNRSSAGWAEPTTLSCGEGATIVGTDWTQVVLVALRTRETPEEAAIDLT